MGKIQVLDKQIAELIAAGEVSGQTGLCYQRIGRERN